MVNGLKGWAVVGSSYSAIQFRTEDEPLKVTTICLSTGSTATMPLVSHIAPLMRLSVSAKGGQEAGKHT